MKLLYDQKALKKAAKFLFKKNKGLSISLEIIEDSILKDLHFYALKNANSILHGTHDFTTIMGTMGYNLLFTHEGEYINCDILVTPSFGESYYIEEEL